MHYIQIKNSTSRKITGLAIKTADETDLRYDGSG